MEGLKLMNDRRPALLLLDLNMPVMSGPKVLGKVRDRWPTLPVIIITAHGDSGLMEEALVYSPFTVLSKPFSSQQLIELVKTIMKE